MKTHFLKSQIQTGFKDIFGKIKSLAAESRNEQSIVEIDGGYRVLGVYEIQSTANNTWMVVHDYRLPDVEFNKLSNAMLFCMAEYAGNKNLAKEIHKLDIQYCQKQFDIQNKIHLLKNRDMDPDVRDVMLTKLDEDTKVYQQLKRQLEKHVKSAKYIKTKGSYYEFTGFGTETDK